MLLRCDTYVFLNTNQAESFSPGVSTLCGLFSCRSLTRSTANKLLALGTFARQSYSAFGSQRLEMDGTSMGRRHLQTRTTRETSLDLP